MNLIKQKKNLIYFNLLAGLKYCIRNVLYLSITLSWFTLSVIADEEVDRKTYMSMKDAENDTNIPGPFESIDDLMESLDA